MANNNLDFSRKIEEAKARLESPEQMLGKGLNEPFNCSNSGARKNLYGIQSEHKVPIRYQEPPIVCTGYENRYGDESSSIIKAENDFKILAKISKFSFKPDDHYFLITQDIGTHNYRVHERISYKHTSEFHGYLYDNSNVDDMRVEEEYPEGTLLRQSTSYDRFGNRQDGINTNCMYLSTLKTMEDSVIVRKGHAEKMATPTFKEITMILNNNDIVLNIYGDNNVYKSWPDIGEEIKGGNVAYIRRENKESSLYTQSYDKLRSPLISDKPFVVNSGTVVDIDVKINDFNLLNKHYNSQIKFYSDENLRFCREFVDAVNMIKANDPEARLLDELGNKYIECDKVLKGYQWEKDDGKVVNFAIVKLMIMEWKPLEVGDKVADRFGGKGVVSLILPDELMPVDIFGNIVDMIINSSTCVNRENPGQLIEMSLNFISNYLLQFIKMNILSIEEAANIICDFIRMVVPEQADEYEKYLMSLDLDDIRFVIESLIECQNILLSVKPISDNITLNDLRRIYKKFNWVKLGKATVPMEDSAGNIRYVETRIPIMIAKKYMIRLKQMSDEKFSVTSLSATNIKNQNTKSKSSKNYNALHANTPVALGNMEVDDLSHLGMEYVVVNLMIHSISPQARRLCEQMLTGDPFAVNIQLDSNSTNRSVEIFNTYMKAKGLRLEFRKIPIKANSLVTMDLVCFDRNLVPDPLVHFISNDERFNFEEWYNRTSAIEQRKKSQLVNIPLVSFEDDL